ncbi:MAG TPA: sugar kinase [Terracidiphilus sp.]|jgi:sugar/nucleoside kinase (ribokinase family)|nr:sugar kinase [Terracidiphilus sp.]
MRDGDQKGQNREARRFDVTLAGDADLDLLFYGLPEELPLEQELLASGMAIRIGGSGAITAHNLAALGNAVGFVTAETGDDVGKLCHAELAHAGVDLSRCVPTPGIQTGVTVHLQHAQQRHMLTYAGATANLAFDDLDLGYLSDARHFHMSSYYLQRALTPRIPELFAKLKAAGLTLSLDPNDDPTQEWDRGVLDAIRHVDVLMPNEREACLLAGEKNLDAAINALRAVVPLLIVKRGLQGASAFAGDQCWHVPAHTVKSVDAIGAGDSFNAGFLHAWLRGWPQEKVLAFANLTAAWSTTEPGGTSAFRAPESICNLLAQWAELERAGSPAAPAYS